MNIPFQIILVFSLVNIACCTSDDSSDDDEVKTEPWVEHGGYVSCAYYLVMFASCVTLVFTVLYYVVSQQIILIIAVLEMFYALAVIGSFGFLFAIYLIDELFQTVYFPFLSNT
jgi:hypothetical protein